MAATIQSQAIANANTIMSLSASVLSLYAAIAAVNDAWQDDNSLATMQAMGTVAINPDGTLGSADTTPNSQHPMNPALYPTLNRAVSVNTLTSALTQLVAITSFINGQAVPATPGVRSILNQLAGG